MLFYCEGKCSSFVKENVVLLHGKENIVLLHGKENVVLLGRKILRYFEGKCLLCYPPLANQILSCIDQIYRDRLERKRS